MALHEVGLLVYSQGFALSRDDYIIRELAFCDWTGHHHVLFKYLLPQGVSYNQLSEEAKTRVDRQTKTVHGLPFEPFLSDYNRQDFHPYHQMRDDITRWCQQHLTPSGDGWACSRSMVCIDCSMSPSLRTPSWSWKGRGAQTWPISPLPPSMLWLTMIMVAIGAWIIPIRHVGLESGTIIAPTYGPVK